MLGTNSISTDPQRIFYITNCSIAEITRGIKATLNVNTQIYPLQSVIYYIRELNGDLILYRQYLSKTGNPRNEPLVDDIKELKIAYAQQIDDVSLDFRNANNVTNWNKIIAVYLQITMEIESYPYSISTLVQLPN